MGYLPYIVGVPLTLFFTTYATAKLLTLTGKNRETLNPLVTGNPEILASFRGWTTPGRYSYSKLQ